MTGNAGLEQSFSAFYDVAVGDVYRYFNRATAGDQTLAERLTQKTFLGAVADRRRGDDRAFTMPSILAAARMNLIEHYRAHLREDGELSDTRIGPPPMLTETAAQDHDVGLHAPTTSEALALLHRLPHRHRLLLVLRSIDDLPPVEIAGLLHRSLGATYAMLLQARTAFDDALREVRDA